MNFETFNRARIIREDIDRLHNMGKGILTWYVTSPNDPNERITDFSLDKTITKAFEEVRLKRIADLEKEFSEL